MSNDENANDDQIQFNQATQREINNVASAMRNVGIINISQLF